MKKTLKRAAYLFAALLTLPMLTFCAKEEAQEPTPETVGKIELSGESSVVLSDEGDSYQVPFTATLDWTASSDAEFLTVEPVSGQAGENAITLRVEKNPSYEERTATVTLTCGEDVKTISVAQKKSGAILLTESTISVEAVGGKVTVVAKATSNVTYKIDDACAEWVKAPSKSGLTEYSFDFVVLANESEYPRTGQIVFTNETGNKETITIRQAGVEAPKATLAAECLFASSSTLVFEWEPIGAEEGEESASEALPYTIALYKDEACEELVVSFEIPEDTEAWGSRSPRFAFGGLAPSTTYYFVVNDTKNGGFSDVVEGTTEAFTVVDPSTVTDAVAGTVLLAEDFSMIGFGNDQVAKAVGFMPSPKTLDPLSGNKTDEDGSYKKYDVASARIFGDLVVTPEMRLYNWGFFGNSSTFTMNGYLRIGSSSSGARTSLVTPALSGIPEGMLATIDVTVTSAIYENGGNDVAVYVNDYTALKRKMSPDEGSNEDFTKYGGKFEGASLNGGYPLEAKVQEWSTKTVRISGVNSNSCLIIGSYEDIDKKNRFFVSDIKVELVSLDNAPDVTASLGNSSSCSLTFTWTEGVSAADDIAKPWTIALYRDEACTDLVVSHNIDAESESWSGKQPRFIFGGLDPNTDYWFKAVDTTEGAVKSSAAIKATTLDFTRVDASTVTNAGVGDIILGEDFSETYGPDEWDEAVGYMPTEELRTLAPPTGEDPDGWFEKYTSTGTRFWGNKVQAKEGGRLANGWGFHGNSAVYSRSGYFRVATTSGRTHIVTPKLAGIPEGSKATISVTVTALLHEKASDVDVAVFVESGLTMNSTDDIASASYCKYSGATWADGHALGLANTTQKKWYTKTVTIDGVESTDQLVIGSLNNVNSKNRFNIKDVVVKIVELEDPNRTTKVSILGDSISTFSGWSDSSKGGAYYPRTDCDVTSVDQTWWHRLIYNYMSTGVFEKNISAGNTTIVQNTTGDSSAYWYGGDFGTRVQQLGLGDPDVIMVFGGTNDYGHTLYNSTTEELIDGVEMGATSFPSSSDARLAELVATAKAATTVAEADALDGTTYAGACIRLIQMLRVRHPEAKIVFIIGDYVYTGMGEAARKIVDSFSDEYVRKVDILGEYGYKANSAIKKFDYAHPTAAGMDVIASYVYEQVGAWIDTAN